MMNFLCIIEIVYIILCSGYFAEKINWTSVAVWRQLIWSQRYRGESLGLHLIWNLYVVHLELCSKIITHLPRCYKSTGIRDVTPKNQFFPLYHKLHNFRYNMVQPFWTIQVAVMLLPAESRQGNVVWSVKQVGANRRKSSSTTQIYNSA